jgi:hypothetical protein
LLSNLLLPVSTLSFLLLHVSLPSFVIFYHVECVTSINNLQIPHAIEPRHSRV